MSLSREYFNEEEELTPEEIQASRDEEIERLKRQSDIGAKASEIQSKADSPQQDTETPTGDSFEENFPGSEDPESFNYRSTNEDGTMRLRDGEIIGPTREQGRYEPSGYAPGTIQDPKVGSPLKPIADALDGPVKGMSDWFTSEINSKAHIWGYPEIPRAPNANSELQDALRDVTALLAPIIAYTRGAKSAVKGLQAKGVGGKHLNALGNDKAFQMFANLGLDVGIGVYVDETSYQQGEDDNLSGSLKKWWPKQTSWIPNWLATSSADSADTRRHKNRMEGGGLNVGVELIGSTARLLKAAYKSADFARLAPRGEKIGAFWDATKNQYKMSPKELSLKLINDSAEQASKNIDDVGAYNLSKLDPDAPFIKPVKGVHDMWTVAELGQRSLDQNGVAGAMTNVAQIAKNIDTQYGRVGNFISSTALKFGLDEDNLKRGWLMDQVVDQMRQAGKWDYIAGDGATKIKFEDISKATTNLAESIMDPAADSGFLSKILTEFGTVAGRQAASDAAGKAINKYMKKIAGLQNYQASAVTQQSLAGQVADLAQTSIESLGTEAYENVIEEMFDRLEMLHVLKSTFDWERKQGSLNPNNWERIKTMFANNDMEGLQRWKNSEEGARKAMLENVIPEAKQFATNYRNIAKEYPYMLKPMYEMYDATNGKVDSMMKLNKEFAHSFTNLEKGIWDRNPEIPNLIVQAGWANVMNSWLSALGTPIKAAFGNVGGLVAQPIGMFGGAILSGDMYMLRRAHYAYGSLTDTFQKASAYAGDMFWKLTTEPRNVEAAMKPDLAYKASKKMAAFESYAKAAEAMGNDGPMIMFTIQQQLEDLALHPLLRASSNSMSGQDLFTGAFQANVQARADAFDHVNGRITLDELVNANVDGEELFKEAYELAYSKIFNEDGIITDPRVRYANSEVSLNADDPVANWLNGMTRSFPIAKSIFSFARSIGNMANMYAVKYNPATPLMAEMPYVRELADDVYKFMSKPYHEMTDQEIKLAMESRGMGDLPRDQMHQKFIEIRHEAKARMAMGTMAVTMAWIGLTQGRLTGNGSWDPKVQRALEARKDWQPKSYKVPGANYWISYEALGPIGDWIASTVDLAENWDTLGEAAFEHLGARMAFVLAANLKDKTVFEMARPLYDIMNGNEGAIARWQAGTLNAVIPGAGLRGEMGRLFEPAQREIDRTIDGYIRNKNKFADKFVPEGAKLPVSHDWIYGGEIGNNQPWWIRAYNVYSPAKIMAERGPEARFLAAAEYDARPFFNKDPDTGVEFTTDERAELYDLLGQDKIFLDGIRKVMKRTEAAGGLEKLMAYRKDPHVTSKRTPLKNWFNIHEALDDYLSRAMEAARARLSTRDRLETEGYIQDVNIYRAQRGEKPLSFETEQFLRDSVNK